MCTAKDLIAWMKNIPEDTVINCLNVGVDGRHQWEELELGIYSENLDYTDLKDNTFCNDEERKQTPTLDIGAC